MAAPPVYRPQTIQAKPTDNGPPVYRPTPLTRPAVSNKLPPAPIIPSIQGSAQAKPVATDVLQQRAVGTRNLLSSSNTSAHAHGGRTEGKAATHTTHPAKPSSAGLIAPQIGARSTTIQREIYKFEGDTWVLERIGTKGGFTPPARPDEGMLYFNTVTGEQGPEIKNVEAGLADLMIMKGSLNDAKIAVPWPEYLWNGLQNGTTDGSVTTLGTIRLKSGEATLFHGSEGWLLPLWKELLEPFMTRNGQLPYIRGQEWYTLGRAVVDVSVNFYNNRPATAALGFHKDTAGDNLFVNLIFNNKKPILATEWTVDKRPMKKAKKTQMIKYMGEDSVANAIETTREQINGLRTPPEGREIIEGGLRPARLFLCHGLTN